MNKTYTYDSDVLAEERDSETTIPVEIELGVSVTADNEIFWIVNSIHDLDSPDDPKAMTLAFSSADFKEEIFRQAEDLINRDAEDGDLYQDWASHLQGEADSRSEEER